MEKNYSTITEFTKEILSSEVGTEKPKIAILGAIFTGFDGVSRVIEQQAKELSRTCDVSIYTLEANMDPSENVGMKTIWSPKNIYLNRIYRLFLPLNLIAMIRYTKLLGNYDLIIAHHYPLSLLAYFTKNFFGVKYVQWHHHIPTEGYTKFHHKMYMRFIKYLEEKSFIIKGADYICSISEFSRELLERRGGIDSIVVYNSVDDRFKEGLNGSKIREKFEVGESPLILFVGRIHPQKNVHTLLEVFKIVKGQVPDAKLMIVGKPIFDEYFEQIKVMSDESVIFAGYVPDEELPYYYAACDVYATCSISEGFNLPVVEAQRCGKPVVAFDIGPHREVVGNGVLVKEGNIEEFAKKLIEVVKDEK